MQINKDRRNTMFYNGIKAESQVSCRHLLINLLTCNISFGTALPD